MAFGFRFSLTRLVGFLLVLLSAATTAWGLFNMEPSFSSEAGTPLS